MTKTGISRRGLWGRLLPMRERDHHEPNRVATTLELLYDLTLVVAFGVAGSELAHAVASGHLVPGLVAFGIIQFATVWAWMNYSWFASAFDTDDWGVRLCVGFQMVGIIILTTGIPQLFHGFAEGWHFAGTDLVAGYVVMRVAMVVMWLRAARANPERAAGFRLNALWTAAVQVIWVGSCFVELNPAVLVPVLLGLIGIELLVPLLLWRRHGATSFHPHHIAERHGLLVIISLGEIVVGTAGSVRSLHELHGWWPGAAGVLVCGVAITLSMWWIYFALPLGEALHRRRSLAFRFGHLHFVLFASIAAVGAGLHVMALQEEGKAVVPSMVALLAIVVPLAVFIVVTGVLAAALTARSGWSRRGAVLFALALVALGASVLLAVLGVPHLLCLAVAMLGPWLGVVAVDLATGPEVA